MAHFDPKLPRDTMRSFAIILLATAVLAAPKQDSKKQDKRSLAGISDGISTYGLPYHGLSSGVGFSGYPHTIGTKVFGSGLSLGNTLSSAYSSGLGYGVGPYESYGTYGNLGTYSTGDVAGLPFSSVPVTTSKQIPAIPAIPASHAKVERITGVTVHREIQVPVPVPHPVPVQVTKHVPVPQPVPVKVDRPYPVPVPQPVPVPVTRHVPVKVDRPYAVPVPQPVEVRVPHPVAVPVAHPVAVPVPVTKHVPLTVPSVNVAPVDFVPSVGISSGISSGIAPAIAPAITPAIASGIAPAIASGSEYVDLGSSLANNHHLATSGAALATGFSTGLEHGAISDGIISNGFADAGLAGISSVEHVGSPLGSTVLAPHAGSLDAGYTYSAPLKKW